MFFTPNQLKEIFDIIEKYHVLFIAKNVGLEVLTSDDKYILKRSGIDLTKLSTNIPLLNHAYKFGVLATALGDKRTKQINYEDFKHYLSAGKFIPLTKTEKKALDRVKTQAYNDIKGLGNRIIKETGQVHIEVDHQLRKQTEKIIKRELGRTIANRDSVKNFVSRLGRATGDWDRDFGRIADYVSHSAYDEGRADHLETQKGPDSLVCKIPYVGACSYCIALYLKNGIGSEPKVFTLSKLRANGTNIGRKQKDWLPVIGPTHPWCRCSLEDVPETHSWNPTTRAFDMPKVYVRQVERKSKVKIQVGDKHFEV